MRGYYQDTLNLINKINDKNKKIPLEKCILSFKGVFTSIANKIRSLSVYQGKIKPAAKKYELEMKEKHKKEKTKEPLFVVYYLDLCRKLKESPTAVHQLMSICVVIPLIDKEICLLALEEKNEQQKN